MPAPKKKPEPLPVGTAEAILAVDDSKVETVEVPEWGFSVRVKPLTLTEQDEIDAATEQDDGTVDAPLQQAMMLHFGIAEPQFTIDQAKALRGKSVHGVLRVIRAIAEINDAGDEAITRAEARFPSGQPG